MGKEQIAKQSKQLPDKRQQADEPAQRLGPGPTFVSFGEPLVGAPVRALIPVPTNRGRAPYQIETQWAKAPQNGPAPYDIGPQPFAPVQANDSTQRHLEVDGIAGSRPGHFGDVLKLTARWPDGHVETRWIEVAGQARADNQLAGYRPPAPLHPVPAVERSVEQERYAEDQQRTDPYPQNHKNTFDDAAQAARDAAAGLAGAQQAGLRTVNSETASYVAPPPMPRSAWWDLLEVALTVATAGAAKGVAGTITSLLAASLSGAAKEADGEKKKDSRVVSVLHDIIREGLKQAGKAAIAKGIPPQGQHTSQFSSHAGIAFFEGQWGALENAATENRKTISEREKYLRPLLRTSPALAIEAMTAIQQGLEGARADATAAQTQATSAQWLVYRTRARLGSETVSTGQPQDGTVVVSKVDGIRPAEVEPNEKPIAGVLDIDINTRGVVRMAYANGIARATADRIATADLRSLKVPLRIVMGRMDARTLILTLDEAGRVRAAGDLALLAAWNGGEAPTNEHLAFPAALALAEVVLSKPLAKHGVRVHTDDAGAP